MPLVNLTQLQPGWMVAKVHPPKLTLTLIAKGTYDLEHGGGATPTEEPLMLSGDLFHGDDETRALRYPSDFAPFKPSADVIVVGRGHAPGGKPTPALRAAVRIGGIQKAIALIGERRWKKGIFGGRMPDPEPFTEMEISYEGAYGGVGFKPNPLGRGYAEETTPEGGRIRRMPTVENPDKLLTHPDKAVDPVSFGPIPLTWPQRMSRAGTYKGKYLKERWPWFPEDFDWAFWNAAPADQQVPYLRGDETLVLENLHPEHPVYESALPGLRVRCFHAEKVGAPVPLREVSMELDTVWVDMDEEKLVLAWRGLAEIPSAAFARKAHLLIASERLEDEPLPRSHYEEAIVAALEEPEEKVPEKKKPKEEPTPPPEVPEEGLPKDLEDELRSIQEEIAEAAKAFEGRQPPGSPPKPPDAASLKRLKDLGIDLPALEEALAAAAAAAEEEPEAEEDEEPEAPEEIEPGPMTREACLALIREGRPLEEMDLTGVDLSRLDLQGVSFRGSVLLGASLRESDLSTSDLTGAVMAEADLTDANLKEATLASADLTGARLVRASLEGASLDMADLSNSNLKGANLSSAHGRGTILAAARLSWANLARTDLEGADLSGCRLDHADLTGACLATADLSEATGTDISAEGADLRDLRAGGASFPGGVFRGATAVGSIWEEADLTGADFSGSDLTGAEFESARLRRALLHKATLRTARLPHADLRGAHAVRANLFQASLEGADLTRTDLSQANLFSANLFEAVLEGTRLENANTKRTLLAL